MLAYSDRQHVERVCVSWGWKDGSRLGWGPMHQGTDDKARVRAFTCLIGVSLLRQVQQRTAKVSSSLSMEEVRQPLGGIQ